MCNTNVNREHKNNVFRDLFSDPAALRELYSAIEGVEIPPDIPVEINTLSDSIFTGPINDLAFTIDNRLIVLVEHQSSLNQNMPLRLLIYLGRIYEQIVDYDKVYNTRLIKIQKPEFIVLYNGAMEFQEHKEIRLSDAFMSVEGLRTDNNSIPLELVVQVYNINHGHNKDILKKSNTLDGYSIFISKMREYANGETITREHAEKAVQYCIDHDILKEYFLKRGSEVINMIFAEYNVDRALEVRYEEGVEDGIEKGIKKEREESNSYFISLLDQGLAVDEIKQRLGKR